MDRDTQATSSHANAGIASGELLALLGTSTALASTLELPEVMQIAISSACDVTTLQTGAIYLLDGAELKLQATVPELPADFPEEYRVASLVDHPHIERCIDSGELVHAEDVGTEPFTAAEQAVCEARNLKAILYVPVLLHDEPIGAFIIGSTQGPTTFDESCQVLARTLSSQIALAIDNARLYESAVEASRKLEAAYDTALLGWATALEMRDHEVHGHSTRVEDLTLRVASAAGVPQEQMEHVRRGAILHDVGKMSVPDSILNKPGPLDDEEWEVMRRHPEGARSLLAGIEFLQPALDIPYCHHERWDGSSDPPGRQSSA